MACHLEGGLASGSSGGCAGEWVVIDEDDEEGYLCQWQRGGARPRRLSKRDDHEVVGVLRGGTWFSEKHGWDRVRGRD